MKVCKKLFRSTLNCSDKFIRTAVNKVKESGVTDKDNRGGRVCSVKDLDERKHLIIKAHINRFPRVESHFYRKDS